MKSEVGHGGGIRGNLEGEVGVNIIIFHYTPIENS